MVKEPNEEKELARMVLLVTTVMVQCSLKIMFLALIHVVS